MGRCRRSHLPPSRHHQRPEPGGSGERTRNAPCHEMATPRQSGMLRTGLARRGLHLSGSLQVAASPSLSRRNRSRAEGDNRLGANRVRHHLGNLAARGSKDLRRCFGVVGTEEIGRAHV